MNSVTGFVSKVMWRSKRYHPERQEGVMVQIPQPIAKELCVPWKLFPATLAGMKMLAGATPYAGAVIDLLDLSAEDVDKLEQDIGHVDIVRANGTDVIEHDSVFMSGVQRAFDDAGNLAHKCPDDAVACDLRKINAMTDCDLEMLLIEAMLQ